MASLNAIANQNTGMMSSTSYGSYNQIQTRTFSPTPAAPNFGRTNSMLPTSMPGNSESSFSTPQKPYLGNVNTSSTPDTNIFSSPAGIFSYTGSNDATGFSDNDGGNSWIDPTLFPLPTFNDTHEASTNLFSNYSEATNLGGQMGGATGIPSDIDFLGLDFSNFEDVDFQGNQHQDAKPQ
jgi:hypothetical protein